MSSLKINYRDNGKGFNTQSVKEKGMGLSNIDARTKLFNGKYILESVPGKETSYSFDFIIAKAG